MTPDRLRPICFMVMPFGVKPTGVTDGSAPAEVDFDVLWEKALRPAITDLDYEAVRADEDLGALIINDMLERLTLADLVVADLTIPNGNVYYEIGIRHGINKPGCVLVSADWSKTLFDLAQMRQIRYKLPEKSISDDAAKAAMETLKRGIESFRESTSPLQAIGFPNPDPNRSAVFRNFIESLSKFQSAVIAARAAMGEDRRTRIEQLLTSYGADKHIAPGTAVELLTLTYDNLGPERSIAFIDSLPDAVRKLPLVKERRALAQSYGGNHLDAIGELQKLIDLSGDSSERQGLLGGRYKKLAKDAKKAKDDRSRRAYIDKAIEHYTRGMMLDLNDYYPASNLPSLLRTRGGPGDLERAQAINNLVVIACEAALLRKTDNDWTKSTLLGAAFDAGDAAKAEELADIVERGSPAGWKLETTIETLTQSVDVAADPQIKERLEKVIARLRNALSG
jgi:tetratricopeptide (TPR) repeat protein